MPFRSMVVDAELFEIHGESVERKCNICNFKLSKTEGVFPTAEFGDQHYHRENRIKRVKGDFVPIYVAIGMIVLQLSIGLFTVKHQILYSPQVRLNKKTRETLVEVQDPDRVVDEADKFLKRSFFRKIAHIQEFDSGLQDLPNPKHNDAFAYKPHAETLKSVGIE